MVRRSLLPILLCAIVSACTVPDGSGGGAPPAGVATSTTVSPPPTSQTTSTTTTSPVRTCDPTVTTPPATIPGGDLVAASIAIAEAIFPCPERAALVSVGDTTAVTRAAIAMNGRGPVLVIDGSVEPVLVDYLARIGLRQIVGIGVGPDVLAGLDVVVIGPPPGIVIPSEPLLWPGQSATSHIWLAEGFDLAALTWNAARATGAGSLPIPDGDVLSDAELVARVRAASGATIVAAGDPSWQLAALVAAPELPGGGLTLFPGRRLVALYGNPTTPFLGVLGEQGPNEGLVRLEELMEGYDADGLTLLPTFEIIATVASAKAGADNDYSDEMAREVLRPWIDFAADHDVYVLLDLQPGRTDFLTQAMYYEEFLRLPHVGLALDPEWRLGPDQVHLRQVGTVDAAEINQVSEWLAGIVREEVLPQKLFMVHQFKLSMITNRELIETPEELAMVIQMDGQGPLGAKYGTFRTITDGSDGAGWQWGWKNFFDEDSPVATPEEVLRLDPPVVFVSFQ